MTRKRRPGSPQPLILDECDVGDVVRCAVGLLKVGPGLSGGLLCRLLERDGEGFRELPRGEVVVGRGTRVVERLRGREWYATQNAQRGGAGGGDTDPLAGQR